MRASSGAASLLILAGCGSTGPGRTELLGSFGAPLGDRTSYLAFRLFETEGRISGRAWSTYSTALIAGATVSGTRTGPAITLTIHPRPPFGLANWGFQGSLAGDTLKGIFSFAGTDAQEVELPRVRTIPLGDYSIAASGAVTDSSTGFAVFHYGGGSFRLVQVFTVPDRSTMVIFWNRRDRPPPGSYPVSTDGGPPPSAQFAYRADVLSPEVPYQVQNGTVTIEESDRYVLAGRFTVTARDPEGRLVTLRGVFSAGCTGSAC